LHFFLEKVVIPEIITLRFMGFPDMRGANNLWSDVVVLKISCSAAIIKTPFDLDEFLEVENNYGKDAINYFPARG
jgi:hypothetical protein